MKTLEPLLSLAALQWALPVSLQLWEPNQSSPTTESAGIGLAQVQGQGLDDG